MQIVEELSEKHLPKNWINTFNTPEMVNEKAKLKFQKIFSSILKKSNYCFGRVFFFF